MALLGVLSVFNLLVLIKNKSTAKVITMLTLVVSMATFGTFTAVGNLGGEIRHSEIRDADSANDADAEDDEEEEEDDDD
jgi:uncharacterized membrane protein